MNLSKHILRRRFLRTLAGWTLIVVQAELLWCGEFHRHEEELLRSGALAFLRQGSSGRETSAPKTVCVACGIHLASRARPSAGYSVMAPQSPSLCRWAPPVFPLPARFPIVLPARAPPVV